MKFDSSFVPLLSQYISAKKMLKSPFKASDQGSVANFL